METFKDSTDIIIGETTHRGHDRNRSSSVCSGGVALIWYDRETVVASRPFDVVETKIVRVFARDVRWFEPADRDLQGNQHSTMINGYEDPSSVANEADLARGMVAKLFLCRFAPVRGFVSVHVFGWLNEFDGRSSRRC